MEKVVRPDGKAVSFAYDPLGRRVSKEFDGRITKYLWDGNLILHEWVEEIKETPIEQSKEAKVFSWLSEDGAFTPIAKLTKESAYSVISDHLGTPNTLLDQNGEIVWKANFDIYGKPVIYAGERTGEETAHFHFTGRYHDLSSDSYYNQKLENEDRLEINFIPFRFQGQYYDIETGLCYNRFRYYSPSDGIYTQINPIGLTGGNPTLYGYVSNPLIEIDPFGLNRMPSWMPTRQGYPRHHLIQL